MPDPVHLTATSLETPDVTAVQKLSAAGLVLLGSLIALVNAFGWVDVDAGEAAAISGAYVAFTGFAVVADAIIRNGRSRAYLNQPKGVVVEPVEEGATARSRGA